MENQKNYLIYNSSPEAGRKAEAEKIIDSVKKEGLEPVEGEIEKTASEIKVIEMANEWFEKEFKKLGIEENYFRIEPERVHILSDEGWENYAKGCDDLNNLTMAALNLEKSAIYIPRSRCCRCIIDEFTQEPWARRFSENKVYTTIFHEMTHLLSKQKFHVKRGEGEVTEEDIDLIKGGVNVLNRKKNHEHFRFLNEAITEKIVDEFFEENQKRCLSELNIDERFDLLEKHGGYATEVSILNTIIKTMKNHFNSEAWNEFKKAVFTGNSKILIKKITEAFGKEAFDMLDKMGDKKEINAIEKFFSKPKDSSL